MGGGWWLVAACLLAAAVAAGWPSGGSRSRWRAVNGDRSRSAAGSRSVVGSRSAVGDQLAKRPDGGRGPGWRFAAASTRGWWPAVRTIPALGGLLGNHPSRKTVVTATAVTAGAAGIAGLAAGGPVAALAAIVYGGIAARAGLRQRATRLRERERRRGLDGLCALAADLRAGLPVPAGLLDAPIGGGTDRGVPETDRIDALARAAARLAERTGAPLAELVERIEADARATDRGLAAATAQAAGARATAWLLAGLPLGGIALGYGVGVDPLDVLLHTPIGAACAVAAIVLQLAGLAWTDRLSAGATRTA